MDSTGGLMNESWWHMGGYAVYVWTSFGLTGVVLLGGALLGWSTLRRQQRDIRLERDQDDDA
ncbi:heme exporter protein CcmD [uncultured Abyssibacter sp.]|uniref:heme exporter protein CcmD n=1 Tax=uncultured Abyssibacter sp. TaxID=2320202 RepID=UPI0032B23A16